MEGRKEKMERCSGIITSVGSHDSGNFLTEIQLATNDCCCLSLQDQNESAAILKIKESMQEEAKRFEKEPEPPDYFMQ